MPIEELEYLNCNLAAVVEAITELGVPDRSATLTDGTTVAEWLTSRGSTFGTAQDITVREGETVRTGDRIWVGVANGRDKSVAS